MADQAESVSVTYSLAMEWSTALDGTPVCYDDGAAFDDLVSTLTLRLEPSEREAWEAIFQGNRAVTFAGWTGLPLGPEYDVSDGLTQGALLDFQIDGPTDGTCALFDAVAKIHYGPLPAPSAGSITAALSRGVPYHSVRPLTKALRTDGGTVISVPSGAESDRTTRWYSSGLTRAEVVDAINWLRTNRGGAFSWIASGVSLPWGSGESTTATCKIPSWVVAQESNFSWGLELEVVRIG